MVNGCTNVAWRQVAKVFHDGTHSGMSDREVLERFVASRDESAFEVLLSRHGPMVLNVCRRLLREPQDVEDAFQAAFLVLVRKAGSIRVEESLGPWLYAVASRTAARARANRRRRREREFSGGDPPEPAREDNLDSLEVPQVVQEELSLLPDRLRNPLILCYLQGLTHELAARQLGCPVGTVRSRLARARALLRKRIVRRGLSLSVAALTTTLQANAKAAVVPPHLRMSLIKVATRRVSESASLAGGVGVTTSVAAILEGVLYVMQIKKLTILATALLSLGALVSVAGFTAFSAAGQLGDKAVVQSESKTGRASDAASVPPAKPKAFSKTYYVGDIVGVEPTLRQNASTNRDQAKIDMDPLIKLISSTVAPGTWEIQDRSGREIKLPLGQDESEKGLGQGGGIPQQDGRTGQTRPTGAIVPFFLSLSLIMKCTPEAHDQVANLLRQLRELLEAREGRSAPNGILMAPPTLPATNVASGSSQKVRQLLDELAKEIAKLTPGDSPTVGP
jgi:RNA polymerase sigma factor (sigma-70 family)